MRYQFVIVAAVLLFGATSACTEEPSDDDDASVVTQTPENLEQTPTPGGTPPIEATPTPAHVATPTPNDVAVTPTLETSPEPTVQPTMNPTPTPAPGPTPSPTPRPDLDGDGVPAGTDCDDTDPSVYPGAEEVCGTPGVDEDCDGLADDADDSLDLTTAGRWFRDADGDSYGDPLASVQACEAPDGYVSDSTDCNDADPEIHPGAEEVCGTPGVDEDCDGLADDADESLDLSTASTWYADADGDGYGDPLTPVQACEAPEGFVADGTDCNDEDADVNPATAWHADEDGDGYGEDTSVVVQCEAPDGYVRAGEDCDDQDAAVHPGAVEVCPSGPAEDPVDEDCDNLIDDADDSLDLSTASTWYADADGDGYGDPDSATLACAASPGQVAEGTDCDDGDPAIHPGAEEVANGVDDDCDGMVDPGLALASCLEWRNAVEAPQDGVYLIDPDGDDGPGEPFLAYCDMTSDGGGWTLMATVATTTSHSTAAWNPWSPDWWVLDHGDGTDPDAAFTNLAADRFAPLVDPDLVLRVTNPGNDVRRYQFGFTSDDWTLWEDTRLSDNGIRIIGPFNLPNGRVSTFPDGRDSVVALCNGHWDDGLFYLGTAPNGADTDGEGLGARYHVGSNVNGEYGYVGDERANRVWHLWLRRGFEPCTPDLDGAIPWGAGPGCPARDCSELHQERPDVPDGAYWIDPDGEGGETPFRILCDMTTDGGGWNVAFIVNHQDSELELNADSANYLHTDAHCQPEDFDTSYSCVSRLHKSGFENFLEGADFAWYLVHADAPTPADNPWLETRVSHIKNLQALLTHNTPCDERCTDGDCAGLFVTMTDPANVAQNKWYKEGSPARVVTYATCSENNIAINHFWNADENNCRCNSDLDRVHHWGDANNGIAYFRNAYGNCCRYDDTDESKKLVSRVLFRPN